MSSSDNSGISCVSEVTLAISKERNSQPDVLRTVKDNPDSDGSGHSNTFTVQTFSYPDQSSPRRMSETRYITSSNSELRIPIIGYEVMEERARFTVYKLRVQPRAGDCWFIFRRYTDFVRLLSQLRRQKASISHLSLPRKKWLGDNFAPSFLEDRIRGLQEFVDGIIKSTILVQIPCVREFFCLDEPPALSDTVEESRAIFEALEDTIYHLRQQLRERDAALAVELVRSNDLRQKLQHIISVTQACTKCRSASVD
ncbi:sorting nexin-16 [Athalia rosae]|uniref:sorting nexin-16 n=1 Tax=Athalia rosae TaxID=37344 RepID=UPI0006262F35|nr:sorting nexin-16 [Athalia rosae]